MPTIAVSDHVKDELERIKADEDHTSYDSVIRVLIQEYEHE